MAERRMFAKTIIDSDAFLDMPLSTQALYFHLSMRADDDGFLNNPKKIMRMVGASEDELRVLLGKKFLLSFESGVVVIKHWKIHNYIRSDRYKETLYHEEKLLLEETENKSYTLNVALPAPEDLGIPDDNQMDTQVRLGKVRLGKVKEDIVEDNTLDTIKSIIAYLNGKLGSKYRSSSQKTKDTIKARLSEDFTFDDFKKVIDIKFNEWNNTDMAKYLRPETLFSNKFEGYLNQPEVKSDKPKNGFHDFKQGEKKYSNSELNKKLGLPNM